MSDLEKAFNALSAKKEPYTRLINYYEGDQPLTYMASSRMQKIFEGLDGYFAQNWCAVVIDAVKDRINLRKIDVKGAAQETWQRIWEHSQLDTESDEVHEKELVTGEAFVICWKNSDGEMEAYYNDPRMCVVFYDSQYPRKKTFAAKWYVDDDEKMRITLYYADHLEYYISKGKAKDATKASAFIPLAEDGLDNPARNPFGEIPVFHYRKAISPRSDLKNVIPIQNATNKLQTDMMVAAEFGAFKQRYVISSAEVQGKLKNSPDEIWDLPAGDGIGQQTQAGQFDATPLDNYLSGIEKQVVAISSITRTPKHYFFQIGSNISGEALIAMEAPLNKKAQDRIDRYAPVWMDVTMFLLRHSGFSDVKRSDITVRFDRPETIQPYTTAQTRQLNAAANIPLETTLREEGKSNDEIRTILQDQERQKTRDANLAKAYLDQARKNFDQNAGGGTQPTTNQPAGGVNA